VNLLEKLHGTWWTRERWSREKPPCVARGVSRDHSCPHLRRGGVREATYEMMRLPTTQLTGRYEQMLTAIARVVVPKRPGRRFPRAVKIKMSNYPLKRRRRVG
jgi:hypothetical protein